MTKIEKVHAAMERIGTKTTIKQIAEESGLDVKSVYAAIFKLRHRKIVWASETLSAGNAGGLEKSYCLAEHTPAPPGSVEECQSANIPLVESAIRRCGVQAGNPFAGLAA